MNSFLERLYHHSPVALQNVGVSLYGLKLYRERYGRGARKHLRDLLESQHYSQEQMAQFQEERFVTLARHAIESVPYYRNWARSIGLESRDIRSLADLSIFPILEKQTVRAQAERLISERYSAPRLLELNTSGTTGTPLSIFVDRATRTYHYAFFSRLRSWFGLPPRSKRATLFGRVILPATTSSPPFWRIDYGQNNLLMSSYHLSHTNLPYYYNKLVSFHPDEIIGYPSSLHALARYIRQSHSAPIPAKAVITTAETLLPYQLADLQYAFNAPVVDQYGCTEMAFFASQCEHGAMHFHAEHGLTEVLNHRGSTVTEGPGRLIATGLINHAMPLIRYDTGDNVTLSGSHAACTCKRPFPIIKSVDGRADDIIIGSDGTPIGRLDPVFKGSKEIKEAQITQHQNMSLTVYIVPGDDFGSAHRAQLAKELHARVGHNLTIEIKETQMIPKDRNGKFRAVVSHYKPGT